MSRTNIVKCKTQKQKEEIYEGWKWQNLLNKTQFAALHGISVRTLNRILDEMSQEECNIVDYDYVVSKNQITIFCDGESLSVTNDYPKFSQMKKMLYKEDFSDGVLEEVYSMMNLPKFIEKFSEGNITVDHENGKVFYGTFEIKNSLTKHLMQKLNGGEDVLSFVKFMDMLLSNPKEDIVEELFGFMEHNKIKIDEDGYIISYKGVLANYNDCWTDTISSKVGCTPVMPRKDVEHNPKKACAPGLHSGSFEYAKSWSRGHIMIIRTHPADVCSVPWDSDSQKMRQCRYEVVGEVTND